MTDPTTIRHRRRVDERLTTSGQPTETQLARIRRLGVAHVVNLGMHDHERALRDERASVQGLGMSDRHIPVVFDAPTEQDVAQFGSALADLGDTPAHIPCIANFRVTAFLHRYRRDALGHSAEDARAIMDSDWRPGGVWAEFIGDASRIDQPHEAPLDPTE